MRQLWDIGNASGDNRVSARQALDWSSNSREDDDHSQAAALREIAWTLSGWIAFVVLVQLALLAFHIRPLGLG